MAQGTYGIATIEDAWRLAGYTSRPSGLPDEYTDDRCLVNNATILSICGVVISESATMAYADGQMIRYADIEPAAVKFNITFANYDGTVLERSLWPYNSIPVYSGSTPTKPSTIEHDYRFISWNPEIVPVKGDATYTAWFLEETKKYIVRWCTYHFRPNTISELETLDIEEYEINSTPTYKGSIPIYDDEHLSPSTYIFDGWEPNISSVTENITYIAKYNILSNQ